MNYRIVARILSAGRLALGVGLVLAPGRLGRGWIGDDAEHASTKVLTRSLGARDIALGGGALLALRRDGGTGAARSWLQAAVVADVVDAVGTGIAFRHLPSGGARNALVLALFSAVLGSRLAAVID